MLKLKHIAVIILCAAAAISCSEEKQVNLVDDMEQIKVDGSNNYKHVFKEQIEKEKYESTKYKRKDFK